MKKYYIILGALFVGFSASSQTDRVTLIETFTSSTCPPCVQGNVVLEGLLADPQNDDKAVSLKYQMSWPGSGDPYFTDEGDIRKSVYSVSGVPDTRLDGNTQFNPASLTQGDLDALYAIPNKVTIVGTYEVNQASNTVEVEVTVTVLEDTPPGLRLYMGIYEHVTYNNTGGNGETQFENVMKKMLPNASGKVMPPMLAGESWTHTETYTFNGNYVLPPNASSPIDHATQHSIEEFSDLGVALFVQTLSTREVYQAGYAAPGIVGLDDNDGAIASAKIYPNPAADNALVAFQSTENQDFKIEVLNLFGQVVYSTVLENVEAGRTTHNIDISELANGMYTVRISSDNGLVSKRLSVQN